MTKLEQAARAIYVAYWCGDPMLPWDGLHANDKARYRTQARAVLESLREPSEGILDAGADAIDDGETPGVRTAAELCWTAMLDAILKEAT